MKLKAVTRTNNGLRIALFDAINGVRTGQISISEATTIHKLATQIIELTKLEVVNAKIVSVHQEKALITKGS
jgi:hypothetical protein